MGSRLDEPLDVVVKEFLCVKMIEFKFRRCEVKLR
jgi:hypothetical protein